MPGNRTETTPNGAQGAPADPEQGQEAAKEGQEAQKAAEEAAAAARSEAERDPSEINVKNAEDAEQISQAIAWSQSSATTSITCSTPGSTSPMRWSI